MKSRKTSHLPTDFRRMKFQTMQNLGLKAVTIYPIGVSGHGLVLGLEPMVDCP